LAEEWLFRGEPAPFREELQELFFAVSGFLKVAEEYGPGYATLFEAKGREVILRLYCLDPSARLGTALDRAGSTVFFSATLSPPDYHARLLGCPEGAHLSLGSPFPGRNLKLVVADHVSTLFNHRERTKTSLARTLACLVRARQGNYILYFPSYAYLELVRPELVEGLKGVEIIIQSPRMSEPEREDFLARFRADNQGTLVGLAVMGGIFGEGIDLKGDRLTGVAVVGVGLPSPSPERELIRSHFDELLGAGFEYAYLFPGFNRVLQAAGRVIRSEADRGVVLLIDQRLKRPAYGRLFPGHWRPVRVPGPAGLAAALARFWGEEEPG
jgi:DNA excision repair protein ERCC-2